MNKYKPGLLKEKYRRCVGMMIINKNKEMKFLPINIYPFDKII